MQTFRLPDRYTLPLIAAGLFLSMAEDGVSPVASLIGGAVGYGLFWAVGHYYFTRHSAEGLGLGDAKLFAASGTWLGFGLLPYVLLIASVGGVIFAFLVQQRERRGIAFGPWLAIGFLTVWVEANFGKFTVF